MSASGPVVEWNHDPHHLAWGDMGLVGWGGPGLRRRQWWLRSLRRIGAWFGAWIPRRAQRFSPRAADRALAAVLKGGPR